jgi:[ribosomal protein S5]-alanine N-acetyltransferase
LGTEIVIETERLILRRLTLDDVDDLAAVYADPETMRFFGGPRTRERARQQIEEALQWYEKIGFYFWATIHKAENRFLGRCGLLPQVIEDKNEAEVAYMIARPYWNQGLGTEAARAIKEYGFRHYPAYSRLVSIIDPRNIASQRVAEKNGMRYLKDIEFEGYIDRLYAIDRLA